MALVFGGKLGRVWLSDFDYLRLAGAEPAVGLRIYLGDRFRPPAVGGVVVAEGTRDGITARGFDSDGGGFGDAAIGQSLSPPLTSRCSRCTS